jgi:hypothetical protein
MNSRAVLIPAAAENRNCRGDLLQMVFRPSYVYWALPIAMFSLGPIVRQSATRRRAHHVQYWVTDLQFIRCGVSGVLERKKKDVKYP